jgi:serpin B
MRLRTFLTPLFSVFLGAACHSGGDALAAPAQAAPPGQTSARLAADPAGNELAMGALHVLARDPGNLFFSGTSLRDALGMTALGADGPTLAELATALHLDPDPGGNVTGARAEAAAWKRAAGAAELAIANRLFVENRFGLDPTFAQRTQDGYGATTARVDFLHRPEPARLTINGWVKETTKNKIPELLPSGSVDESTRMVLVNAIYFKGSWADAFPKTGTYDATFHAAAGDVRVPTMHRTGAIAVGDNAEATVVELPYKDSGLSMLVVLPKNGGVDALASRLTAAELTSWASAAQKQEVDLAMPKFSFSWGRSVKGDLEQLGVHRLFGAQADLTKITGGKGEPLFVSDVVHKAFVQVDEVGTEAAAATGVVMKSSDVVMHRTVSLDAPFLFFVRDRATGNVLFSGRLATPQA